MALRARPAQWPCLAWWQNLMCPGVVPVDNVVRWIVPIIVGQYHAADWILQIWWLPHSYKEVAFFEKRLKGLRVGSTVTFLNLNTKLSLEY
jgi:hypothetical protein